MDGITKQITTLTGGNANERLAFLTVLIGKPVGVNEAVTNRDGEVITTTEAQFMTDVTMTKQTQQLFRYLYGDVEGIADNVEAGRDGSTNADGTTIPVADSADPNIHSIAGRHQNGILRSKRDAEKNIRNVAGYQKVEDAPDVGSGTAAAPAPATQANRRIVVQDTNQDGSIRLRTIDMSSINAGAGAGVNQQVRLEVKRLDLRVSGLSRRLDRGIAMASALAALPNITPGNNRYALGLGVGNHGGESAIAMGFSGRVGEKTHYNLGVATSGGGSTTSRSGVSWAW